MKSQYPAKIFSTVKKFSLVRHFFELTKLFRFDIINIQQISNYYSKCQRAYMITQNLKES